MPIPHFHLAKAYIPIPQAASEEVVILRYKEADIDRRTGYGIYRGGVEVLFGPTRLVTDTLIIRDSETALDDSAVKDGEREFRLKNHEAVAVGKVQIIDPDGTIEARDLWYTWDEATTSNPKAPVAKASDFLIQVGRARIFAQNAEKDSTGWKLRQVSATTDNTRKPAYEFKLDSLDITPGKAGVARGVQFKLFGGALPKIPSLTFSLDRRVRATRPPQLTYRQQGGLGVAWDGNFLFGDQRVLSASASAFPGLLPAINVSYTLSETPAEKSANNQFTTASDFGERQAFSYFENIYAGEVEFQNAMLGFDRKTTQIAVSSGIGTFGRKSDLKNFYTKPLELVHERSGYLNGSKSAFFYQGRVQSVSEDGGAFYGRLRLTGGVVSEPRWNGRLLTTMRLDGGVLADVNGFGWAGGEIGASYEPRENFRLSAGVYGYETFGTPLFVGDRFVSNQGLSLRGDLYGKATKISMMWRYDPAQGWFDRQFRISQVFGPVEPVIIYRANPNEYQFGLRFRIDELLDLAIQRSANRSKKSTKIRP